MYDTSSKCLFKGNDPFGKALINYEPNSKRIIAGNSPAGQVLFSHVFDNNYSKLVEGPSTAGTVVAVYDKLYKPDNRFRPSMSVTKPSGFFRDGKIREGGNMPGKVLATFSNNYEDMPEGVLMYIASQLYLNMVKKAAPAVAIPVMSGSFKDKDANDKIVGWYKGGDIWLGKEIKGEPHFTTKRIDPYRHVKFYEGKDQSKPAVCTYYQTVLYKGDVDGPQNLGVQQMCLFKGDFFRPGEESPNGICHTDPNFIFIYKGQWAADKPEGEPVLSFPSSQGRIINPGSKAFFLYKLYFKDAAKRK